MLNRVSEDDDTYETQPSKVFLSLIIRKVTFSSRYIRVSDVYGK
jgi:hypothetical protein